MKWTLESLETTAGYLQPCPVTFAPGLNCIIGARGTCKSTIVETIRFVFDCEPERIAPMLGNSPATFGAMGPPRAGLILETLAGGTARCALSQPGDPSEPTFVLERNPQSSTRVFRDGVQQIDGAAILHRIEIYSQGDLQTIAEQPERRLALIDRPNQHLVGQLSAQQHEYTTDLRKLGAAIRQRRPEIESREAKIRELESSRRRLAELQANRPSLSPELEAERTAHESRQKTYERLKIVTQIRDRILVAARAVLSEETTLRESADFAASVSDAPAERIATALKDLLAGISPLRKMVDQATSMQPLLEDLAGEYRQRSARFYDLRKDQQGVNEALKSEEALRHAIAAMEKVAAELSTLREEQAHDTALRIDLRARRDAAADQLYSLRLAQVDAINAEYGNQIVLTLQQGVLTDPHRRVVEEMLQGSNLRSQADVARDLAERVRPSDLVDIVEAGDAKRLADALGRDLGQMTRLVSHLLDSPRLYDLETIVVDDGLEVTMVIRGESRPIGQLSKGQMATALLPLILREADYPLIVDQPEDDLDNAFVFQHLIDRIRTLSARRQIIFVTHNANIPVLGDAASVLVMDMDGPRRALPCRSGDVEAMKSDIIRILEGGKEAFKTRHQRYSTELG